jgi:hypothetical protein
MEKSYCLNIQTPIVRARSDSMQLGEYFLTLEYTMMAATFIALALIFLYVFYGKEEKEED